MRILDFRFNGLTIEPVVDFNSSEKMGCQISMNNIKSLGEAARLRETLDIAIRAMAEKEKQDDWERIIALEDSIDKAGANLDIERGKLVEMRKAYADRHYSSLSIKST